MFPHHKYTWHLPLNSLLCEMEPNSMNCVSVFYFAMLCVHLLPSSSFLIHLFLYLCCSWCSSDLVSKERCCCHQSCGGEFWVLPNFVVSAASPTDKQLLQSLVAPSVPWMGSWGCGSFLLEADVQGCHRTSSQTSNSRFNGFSSVYCFLVCSLHAQHLACRKCAPKDK